MTIFIKNKHTLQIDEFVFKCCIGKKGSVINKKEGDKKTPKTFEIGNLYFRKDRLKNPLPHQNVLKLKDMGWCDDTNLQKNIIKLLVEKKIKHEKLKRKDSKYNLLIPIKYNFKKPITGKGSCIFIHLTKDYKPTTGCIALKEKDFLIMLN